MKFLICSKCKKLYNGQLLWDSCGVYRCPSLSCHNTLDEIDEMCVPYILELNNNGIETVACCSGHYVESYIDTYVMFRINYDPEKLKRFITEYDSALNDFAVSVELVIGDELDSYIMKVDKDTELPEVEENTRYKMIFRFNHDCADDDFPHDNKDDYGKLKCIVKHNESIYNAVALYVNFNK